MKRLLLVFLVSFTTIPTFAQERTATGDIRVGRYTTLADAPADAQSNPLDAVVVINFPRTQVSSVGDAVAYLLLRTGYRLTDPDQLGPEVKDILALSLPEVHRRVGPYSVRAALQVLIGTPFQLSIDPMRRQIAYAIEANGAAKVARESTANLVPTQTTPAASRKPSGVTVFPFNAGQ
jgi:type IV pili sensor histidine kinase/response regulator